MHFILSYTLVKPYSVCLSLSDSPHLLFTLNVVTNGKISSFFMAESYSILYTVDP